MTVNSRHPALLIGISSCLLGNKVRYDGGDTFNPELVNTLSDDFELVPFCPEVAIGMGIPRAPIRLVDSNGEIRALGVDDPEHDMTGALLEYGHKTALQIQHLSGFVFKSNSPSCGISGVNVFDNNDRATQRGQGLFAAQIVALNPRLPVIDEVQFLDSVLQQDFIAAVYAYNACINSP